jgi:hypothetical protein
MSIRMQLRDCKALLNDPMFSFRLKCYTIRWEKENTEDSRRLLETIDKFCKLMEALDG